MQIDPEVLKAMGFKEIPDSSAGQLLAAALGTCPHELRAKELETELAAAKVRVTFEQHRWFCCGIIVGAVVCALLVLID